MEMVFNQRMYDLAEVAVSDLEVLSGDELTPQERNYVFKLSQFNIRKDSFRIICREGDQPHVTEWWRDTDGTILFQTRPVTEEENIEEIPAIV